MSGARSVQQLRQPNAANPAAIHAVFLALTVRMRHLQSTHIVRQTQAPRSRGLRESRCAFHSRNRGCDGAARSDVLALTRPRRAVLQTAFNTLCLERFAGEAETIDLYDRMRVLPPCSLLYWFQVIREW